MGKYVLRRLAGAVPLVLGIATIIFVLIDLAPGSPIDVIAPHGMSSEGRQQLIRNFGLDQPLHVRYVRWLTALFTGDLGYSFSYSKDVRAVLIDFFPNTLLLSVAALSVSFFFGIVFGTLQAVRQYSALDSGMSVALLFFYSMPSFWLALMLILVFSLGLGWFPVSGLASSGAEFMPPFERFVDRLRHLALPALSLALVLTAGIARYMRGSMLEVVRQDYVRTAHAKGLPERVVVFKHALRNALLPIITLVGLYLPFLFSGTVFIESIFAWPGMGRALVGAIVQRDYALVVAGTFFFASMVVVANLVADVLYAVVDPRIRYE